MAGRSYLTEVQRLPTSGARAVEAFEIDGVRYLAVPQLAYDMPETPEGINGGTSNTDVLLFRLEGKRFVFDAFIPGPGGEDVEHFEVDGRHFLAVASLRVGRGPYNYNVASPIYRWEDGRFTPFQSVLTHAAKQWRHFSAGGINFLALAQGMADESDSDSKIFAWDGLRFEPFQDIRSRAGYNVYAFELSGTTYLAHADHADPSVLYRFDGRRFVEHQELLRRGGRAFALMSDGGGSYLAAACILGDSQFLRWDGKHFVDHQVLTGAGGREFAAIATPDGSYLVRVNFITGTPAAPNPALRSQIYRLEYGHLSLIDEFDTTGATDVTELTFPSAERTRLIAVSQGLSADAHFRSDTLVLRFDPGAVR